jgi:outer membrane lipoprotein-sorting protein
MYFRRGGNNVEMAAMINKHNNDADSKQILFSGGLVQVYLPGTDQLTKYNAGKNRDAFESFLVLGFGGRGHDLSKSFDVKYGGAEAVNGVQTQKLVLTPKSEKVRGMFQTITLWIDPARGISLQQKFESSDGDYRLATYKNVKLNEKLPDVFKLKTTGKTTVVTPQG